MAVKKPTIKETITQLQQQVQAGENNRELLEEALYAVEQQLMQDGWMQISATSGKELTKQALDIAEGWGRAYWIKNPLVRRAIELQALYVFAQGMTIKAESEEVDVVVQDFMEDPKNYLSLTSHQAWKQNERALFTSGNRFFVFFTNESTGVVRVRTIPFSEIREVIKNPEDSLEPWFYRRDYTVSPLDYNSGAISMQIETAYYPDWQYIPDDKPETINSKPIMWDNPVYHVKTNCLDDMTFGIPETLSITDWAKAYKRFLENLATVWEAQARIAQVITTSGGPRAVAAAKAKYESVMGETSRLTGDNLDVGRPVGTTFTASESVKIEPYRTGGSTTSVTDGIPLRLMVGSGSGIPDQMLSADPSTGNLATAKAMERPLELQFRDRQTLWADVWMDILEYVINQSIAAPLGKLHDSGTVTVDDEGREIYTLTATDENGEPLSKAVSVTFPPILEHDVMATITALKTAATLDGAPLAGIFDMKTLAEQIFQALRIPNAEEILGEIFPDGAERQMQTPYAQQQSDNAAAQATAMQAQGDINNQIQADAAINQMAAEAARELKEVAARFQEADEEGRWITTDSGNKLLIGGDGKIAGGRNKGKTLEQAFGGKDKGSSDTQKGTDKATSKSTTKTAIKTTATTDKDVAKQKEKSAKAIFKQKSKDVENNLNTLYSSKEYADKKDVMTRADITPEELNTVGEYQGAAYRDMNARQRGKDLTNYETGSGLKGDTKAIDGHIERMNSVIDKSPLPEGLSLYRGVSGSAGAKMDGAGIGDIIEDKGFQSFTADPNIASNFARGVARPVKDAPAQDVTLVMQYVTGKNDKALPLIAGKAGFEKEFVMKPGKFKVMETTEYKTGYNKVTKVIQLAAA